MSEAAEKASSDNSSFLPADSSHLPEKKDGVKPMTNRKAYLILQTVLILLLAVILCVTAADICREGMERREEDPLAWIYTREIAEEKFGAAAPLFFFAAGTAAAGILLGVRDEKAEKPVRDASLTRDLAVSRVAEPSGDMKKERALQKKLDLGGWILFAVCCIPAVVYLADGAHFPDGDPEPVIAALAAHVLPWMAAAVACLMISAVLQEKSICRETEAAKARIREEKAAGITAEPKPAAAPRKTGPVRAVLLAAAVLFLILGILNGSALDVLYKAAKICTECVGLG